MTDKDDAAWKIMYEEAKAYLNEYGHLYVPVKYVTKSGRKLGVWFQNQRQKCDPESERGKLLLQLYPDFYKLKRTVFSWDEMYEEAKKYVQEHGKLDCSNTYVTRDGKKLGQWLHTKKSYCDPESAHGKLLADLGFSFEPKLDVEIDFNLKLDMLDAFFKKYGVGVVPYNFKTKDGITYDENGINLGMWYLKQLERCNPESNHGIMLRQKGACFERNKLIVFNWEQAYEIAKTYYNRVGNMDVPYNFRTCDGITYNEYGLCLKRWLYEQVNKCNLKGERRDLLRRIGIDLGDEINISENEFVGDETDISVNEIGALLDDEDSNISLNKAQIKWLEMYKSAVEFYNEHGHLEATKYSSDDNEVSLARWLIVQKANYRKKCLSEEKISMLERIWIIWDVRDNKVRLVMICDKNNIDVYKNRDILSHMPYYVLEEYINTLTECDAVDEKGRLRISVSYSDDRKKYTKKRN